MVRWSSGPRYRRCRQRADRIIRTLAGKFVTFRGGPPRAGSIGRQLWDRILGFARERAYEPEFSEAIRRLVQPGWVCADVGACKGVITGLLAETVGDHGLVIAFEAMPENARQLQWNLRLKGLESRIKVENVAVTDGVEPLVALFPGRNSWAEEWNIMGHDVDGNPTDAVLKVPAVSLDGYFPSGAPLNFVKIDIEGAGALALAGMRRLLREARPVLLIEFHDDAEWNGRFELYDAGYELWARGRRLDQAIDTGRVYHCLATPLA